MVALCLVISVLQAIMPSLRKRYLRGCQFKVAEGLVLPWRFIYNYISVYIYIYLFVYFLPVTLQQGDLSTTPPVSLQSNPQVRLVMVSHSLPCPTPDISIYSDE